MSYSTIDVCNVCGDRGVNSETGCSCDPEPARAPGPPMELRVLSCGHAQYVDLPAPFAVRCLVCHTQHTVYPLSECIRIFDTNTNGDRLLRPDARRGVWALHRTLRPEGRFDKSWTISHVPTGAALEKSIETRERAVALLASLPEDFAPHAGFGPAGAAATGRRRNADEIKALLERWRAT